VVSLELEDTTATGLVPDSSIKGNAKNKSNPFLDNGNSGFRSQKELQTKKLHHEFKGKTNMSFKLQF